MRALTRVQLLPLLLMAALAAGCADGGTSGSVSSGVGAGAGGSGGGASVVPAPGAAPFTPHASGATAAQANTALAALGSGPVPTASPLALDAAGLGAWNDLIARTWPDVQGLLVAPLIEGELRTRLAALSTTGSVGTVGVTGVRDLVVDTRAPLALYGLGAAPTLGFEAAVPRRGDAWRVAFTVDVIATATVRVLGIPITTQVTTDVRVEVRDVAVTASVAIDAQDPARPRLLRAGTPSLALRLLLTSQDPILSQITAPLTQILDPVIRVAVLGGALYAQHFVAPGLLASLPSNAYGRGGPAPVALAGALPLEPFAEGIAETITRDCMPYDMVYIAHYTSAVQGQGSVAGHTDQYDSPCWSGHFQSGEAWRYDVTGDPRAEAAVLRVARGLERCLDLIQPGGGHLSRCAVPDTDPVYAQIAQDRLYNNFGTINGVPHAGYGDVSRDQYLGAIMGLSQGHLRVPSVRPKARELTGRMLDYLERNEWNVYLSSGRVLSRASPLSQAPGVSLAYITAGNAIDPARWGALHARMRDLASCVWLGSWLSTREPVEDYFKFALFHMEVVITSTCTGDPWTYREVVKETEIVRDTVGHHRNAWFDASYGALVPAAAPAMRPLVTDGLARFTLRPRRHVLVQNSLDPTIPQVVYSGQSYNNQQIQYTNTRLLAPYPIPVERRPPIDFLWQQNPFQLDGGGWPERQDPGIDFTAPYWLGRAFGVVQ